MSVSKKRKKKIIGFRLDKEGKAEAKIDFTMKRYNLNKSQAILKIFDEHTIQQKTIRELKETNKALVSSLDMFRGISEQNPNLNQPKPDCVFFEDEDFSVNFYYECYRDWEKKGKIRKVSLKDCGRCNIIKHAQRQQKKMEKMKNEQEHIKQFYEETKQRIHERMKDIKRTIENENRRTLKGRRFFTNEYGMKVRI